MSRPDTVERILDVSERLFATHGITATSLRMITQQAGVNLAAVNYHFGSKAALVQAVFARFLEPFCKSLSTELDRLSNEPGQRPTSLVFLFNLLVEQALYARSQTWSDLGRIIRLLGRVMRLEPSDPLRVHLDRCYGAPVQRFITQVGVCVPHVPPTELCCRLHFAFGAVTMGLGSSMAMPVTEEADILTESVQCERVLEMLKPFLLQGLSAPAATRASLPVDCPDEA